MRFVTFPFFSAFLLAVPFVSAAPHLNATLSYDPVPQHEFNKCAAFCGPPGKGVELRGSMDGPGNLNYGLTCRTQMTYPRAYTYDYTKRNVTSRTVFPKDGEVTAKEADPMASEANDPWTCDHIIEIQIFGKILGDSQNPRSNSVCAIAASGKYANWESRLNNLKVIINSAYNVGFFTTDLEKIKGPTTQAFLAANPHALHDVVDAEPGKRVQITWGPNAVTGTTDLEWLAFENYLKRTATRTKGVAEKMDRAIESNFPGAEAGTAKLWKSYMDAVTHVADISRQRVQARMQMIKCAQKIKKDAEDKAAKEKAAAKETGGNRLPKPKSKPGSTATRKPKTKTKPRELFDRLVRLVRRVTGRTKATPKAPTIDSETPLSCPVSPKQDTPPSKPRTPDTAKPKPAPTTPKTTKPTVPKTTKPKPVAKPKPVHTTPKTTKPAAKPKASSPKPKPKVTKPAPRPAPRPKARLPAPRKKTRPRRLELNSDSE